MAKAQVTVKGLKKTQAFLERSKKIMKGDPELQDQIGQFIKRDIRKQFSIGGDPPWTPSKRAERGGVVKRGKRKGEHKKGKTLLETGKHLRDTIEYEVRRKKLIIGTNSKIAPIHNFGGVIKRKGKKKSYKIRMPKREFMKVRPNVVKGIKKRIAASVAAGKPVA